MNCQACRKHLHPYMDSELEVQQNLEILEHLNACSPCREIFGAEEAAWERVRSVIGVERAPDAFRESLPRVLADADRRETWRKALGYVVPLGIAAAFAIFMLSEKVTDPHQNLNPHHGGHNHRDHGPGVTFAVSHWLQLDKDAKDRDVTLLSREFLEHHDEMEELDAEGARRLYKDLMGPTAEIPHALRGKGIEGAAHETEMDGTPVHGLLLSDHKQQKYGLYVLDAEKAGLADMHPLGSQGMHEGVRLDRCRGCHVIAITREDKVYIIVTQNKLGVDSAIELARGTF